MMTIAESEAIRADSTHFGVVPQHEQPEIETTDSHWKGPNLRREINERIAGLTAQPSDACTIRPRSARA